MRLIFACLFALLPMTAVAQAPVPAPKPIRESCLGPERILEIFTSMGALFKPLPMTPGDSMAYLDAYDSFPPVGYSPADSVLLFSALADVRVGSVPVSRGGVLIVRFVEGCAQGPLSADAALHQAILERIGRSA